ncbi:hypothetical protein [Petrachloros mirabilis]
MKKPFHKKSRSRFTIVVDPELLALARTAVHQMKGLTLAKLIETGMRLEIQRLERKRGRRFRPMQVRLRAGRPRKIPLEKKKRT